MHFHLRLLVMYFVQSNMQHVSPVSQGFAPRLPPGLCPWTPLGDIRHQTPPGHVFVESLAEIDPRKVAEVVRRTRDKKRLCDPFFRALSETHSAISLETCKA